MNIEIENKDYIQNLPIRELVDLKEVIWKMRHNDFSWPTTKEEYNQCTNKITIIDTEIKRRIDLIK